MQKITMPKLTFIECLLTKKIYMSILTSHSTPARQVLLLITLYRRKIYQHSNFITSPKTEIVNDTLSKFKSKQPNSTPHNNHHAIVLSKIVILEFGIPLWWVGQISLQWNRLKAQGSLFLPPAGNSLLGEKRNLLPKCTTISFFKLLLHLVMMEKYSFIPKNC